MLGSKPQKYGSTANQTINPDEYTALVPSSDGLEFSASSGYRVSKKRTHCAPRKFRFPIFFDLITDRSRFRFLAPLLFTLAFLLLIDVFIIKNLTDPLIAIQQPGLPEMDIFVAPSSSAKIGSQVPQQPQAQIRNHELLGLSGYKISITLRRIYLTSGWLSTFSDQLCDFQSSNPVPSTLLSLEYESLCQVQLMGTTATTNGRGIAHFQNFT